MTRVPAGADDKGQSKAFLEAAKEHGADGRRSNAAKLIGKLAKQPPKPRPKKKRAQR